MTTMIPGVVAEEYVAVSVAPDPINDVVFQCQWSGTNNGTNAIDESIYHAPLTFSALTLSNEQTLFGLPTSLKSDLPTDFVSAPANAAYDNIGLGDFTVETFLRVTNYSLVSAQQVIGVFATDKTFAQQLWRVVYDSQRVYFQAKFGASLLQWSAPHSMLLNTWQYLVFCRSQGSMRIFLGEVGAQTTAPMIHKSNMIGAFTPTPGIPLYIAGNPAGNNGAKAYFQSTRVTSGAWYRTDDPIPIPDAFLGFGEIFPSLVPDIDVFMPGGVTRMGDLSVGPMVDADLFFAPTATRGPIFVNATVTLGTSAANFITSTLVGSRVNGNLLIAWVMTQAGGKTFSVGGGWTMGDQQQDANSSAGWAWRVVDGTEAAPSFTWGGAAATAHSRMLQFSATSVGAPIGVRLKAQGASANLTINGGVGLTTNSDGSVVLGIMLTSSNSQVIPLPTGYVDVGGPFNNSFGSNRQATQNEGPAGTVSGPIDLVIALAFWHGFMLELNSVTVVFGQTRPPLFVDSDAFFSGTVFIQGTLRPSAVVDTDTFYSAKVLPDQQLAPSFFADTDTFRVPVIFLPSIRATQVVQQVLEKPSTATNLRATQVVQQTLRSIHRGAFPDQVVIDTDTFYPPSVS